MRIIHVFVFVTLTTLGMRSNNFRWHPFRLPPVSPRQFPSRCAPSWMLWQVVGHKWIDKNGRVVGEAKWCDDRARRIPFTEENRSTVNGKLSELRSHMVGQQSTNSPRIWCDATINDEGCSGSR